MGKKRRIDRIINNMKIVAALAILLSSVELSIAGDSIYDLAKATDDLSTLAVAIEAAGLEETLSDCDAGPFTVFAPQNSAFANFDQDVLADLLKPENQEALQNVILYHAVPGKITAKQILHGNVKQAEKTKKRRMVTLPTKVSWQL